MSLRSAFSNTAPTGKTPGLAAAFDGAAAGAVAAARTLGGDGMPDGWMEDNFFAGQTLYVWRNGSWEGFPLDGSSYSDGETTLEFEVQDDNFPWTEAEAAALPARVEFTEELHPLSGAAFYCRLVREGTILLQSCYYVTDSFVPVESDGTVVPGPNFINNPPETIS